MLVADCPMQFFVGYREDVAVSAGELFLNSGTAGIYGIATKKEYRRRGIGLATTGLSRPRPARSERRAVLQASEAGRGVYERLGFEPCCEFAEYRSHAIQK